MLDFQRLTISVILDGWCREALHRIKLVCYVTSPISCVL